MSAQTIGSCCKDLKEALTTPPTPLFRVEENGVLFVTIGYASTKKGTAWVDQAVFYCPFCGTKLQDRAEIKRLSQH
jgi:hypothetical protein